MKTFLESTFFKNLKKSLFIGTGITLFFSSCAGNKLEKQIDFALNRGINQYSYMMKKLPENR